MTRRKGAFRLTDSEVGGWKFSKVSNLMNFKFPKMGGGAEKIYVPIKNSILGVKNVILLKH